MQIRKNRSGFLVIVFLLVGVYFFLLGENGILERIKLIKNKDKITDNISQLGVRNQELQKEYEKISDSRTNKSFYKEEASNQGYISGREKYIFFKSSKNAYSGTAISPAVTAVKKDSYPVQIPHLRIIWIASSILILSLFIWKKNSERKREEENT